VLLAIYEKVDFYQWGGLIYRQKKKESGRGTVWSPAHHFLDWGAIVESLIWSLSAIVVDKHGGSALEWLA